MLRALATIALLTVLVCCGRERAPQATLAAPTATPTALPTPTAKPSAIPRRVIVTEAWIPFAQTNNVVLRYPSNRVELTGYHQSNHEGAQELKDLPGVVRPVLLDSRDRLTSRRTAADVVIDPAVEVRAPVTGRVKRAGTYTLYCKYTDDYVVIAPDSHPDWEVKILHIDHEVVHPGDRVAAGESVIAQRPTRLPFSSDTDEYSAKPPWPHVHIEVVNPAIRNVPNANSGC